MIFQYYFFSLPTFFFFICDYDKSTYYYSSSELSDSSASITNSIGTPIKPTIMKNISRIGFQSPRIEVGP